MARENIELVRFIYEGYARRSVEPYRPHFVEDFKFHNRPEFPVQDVYGLDDMQRLWADLDETFTEYELTPTEFREAGDHVIVTLEASAKLRGGEARIEETIYHVWHLLDGKAREAWTFTSFEEAAQRAGLED